MTGLIPAPDRPKLAQSDIANLSLTMPVKLLLPALALEERQQFHTDDMMPTVFNDIGNGLAKGLQAAAFWIAAALPLALLAALAIALAAPQSAHAAETSCNGRDLIAEMKSKDPATYQRVVDEAARIPNGDSIFWKIEKDGIPASYLLGTMHVSDPRVLKMPAGADEARQAARLIAVESDEVLDDKKAMAGLLSNPELTMFTDGSSMETHLSAADLAVLDEGLRKRGIPLAAVSRMKPWMLMSFLSIPACEMARKNDSMAFLDKKVAVEAQADGKPVKGLETFAEQLSTLAAIPIDQHMKSLIETIRLGSKMDDVFETMTDLYVSGQVGMTMPFLKEIAPEDGKETAYGDFEELVIRQRNHRMAERAAALLDQGGAFIAVGALHLPGEDGLVELFRKQGYRVTAVR